MYLRHDAATPMIFFLTFPSPVYRVSSIATRPFFCEVIKATLTNQTVQDNAVNTKHQAYPPSIGPVMHSFVLEI